MKPIINGTVIVTSDEARDTLVKAITTVAVTEITSRRDGAYTTIHVNDLPFTREAYLRDALHMIASRTAYGTLTIYENGAMWAYKYQAGRWWETSATLELEQVEAL